MSLLFGVYWFLLRKEKMFIFNRFFLIFSVIFSLLIPVVILPVYLGYRDIPQGLVPFFYRAPETKIVTDQYSEDQLKPEPVVNPRIHDGKQVAENDIIREKRVSLILVLYFTGLSIMIIRFLRNLNYLNNLKRSSEKIDHEWYQIALLENHAGAFSFFNVVFLNRADYLGKKININVLNHELEHVRQAHSIDIVFFEIVNMLFWFNPVFFLYKHAVRLNHEYLADEAVIRNQAETRTYATELINYIKNGSSIRLASGMSPSMIRLRLLMLNTNSAYTRNRSRTIAATTISTLLMIILSIKPAYTSSNEGKKGNKGIKNNDDIITEEVKFRDTDFEKLNSVVVIDGKILNPDDSLTIDVKNIKNIEIIAKRKAVRKYGRQAKNGALEITSNGFANGSAPDSLHFKKIYTINSADISIYGHSGKFVTDSLRVYKKNHSEKPVKILVSNLFSASIWTYPIFHQQDSLKRWRIIELYTRDYFRIKGKVIQRNGQPLRGATINLPERNKRVTANEDGEFFISDVNPGVTAEISAEGYKSLKFKVKPAEFGYKMNITLVGIDEQDPDEKITILNNNLKVFSGTWKFNKEMSTNKDRPYSQYIIRQFDSDSIVLHETIFDKEEINLKNTFHFNTISINSPEEDAIKTIQKCVIGADGKSFFVTLKAVSFIGRFRGYKTVTVFSLNESGDQLTIQNVHFQDPDSIGVNDISVFDKI
ncbi:MAG TPA: M56 family metallopeptidase [Bacteroidales bacterium]|nr:M56 family metallopeptidase [Bacteroidales bacterium]